MEYGDGMAKARGELSGADLRRLYLIGIPFKGTRCYRKKNQSYFSTLFDESLLDERNFLPQGHIGEIQSVCYSPDGKKILSGSDDSTIKEWPLATGECLHAYRNVTCLFIQGCSFLRLHPGNRVTPNTVNLFKEYGVIIN